MLMTRVPVSNRVLWCFVGRSVCEVSLGALLALFARLHQLVVVSENDCLYTVP